MDLRWITAWVDGQGWLDPTADALPEDVVMPDRPDGPAKPKRTSAAAKRRRKHGRPG